MTERATAITLGPRFTEALVYAATLHAEQRRHGSDIPYVSHLLGVCALVLEGGGDEEQAIAALLHDALEDQGDKTSTAEIERRFGARAARIVLACTDSTATPRPPWRQRKEAYLAHLPAQPPDVLLVSVADKLYNARTILADHRLHGDALFTRFSGGKDGVLWYYSALVDVYQRAAFQHPHVDELARTVHDLLALALPEHG